MFIDNDVIEYIKGFYKLEGDFKEIDLEKINNENFIIFQNEDNQCFGISPINKNLGKIVRIFKGNDKFFLNYYRGILQIRYTSNVDETYISEAFVTSYYKCFDGKVFDFDLELIIIKLGEW